MSSIQQTNACLNDEVLFVSNVGELVSFPASVQKCVDEGMTLARISNRGEHSVVKSFIANELPSLWMSLQMK